MEHASGHLELGTAELCRLLAGNPLIADVKQATYAIASMAGAVGGRGAIRVIDGDERGWADLGASWEYHAWCVLARDLVSRQAFDPRLKRRRASPSTVAALCVASAIAFGFEHRLMPALLRLLGEDAEPRDEAGMESFVLTLARQQLDASDLQPPYGDLLTSWGDDRAFAKAVERASDYHCTHVFPSASEPAEFEASPFDLVPVEIIAVVRVRARALSCDEIWPNHPLLRDCFRSGKLELQPTDQRLELVSTALRGLGWAP